MHIKGIPMIMHVLKSAIKSGVGEVYVSTPDKEILEVVHKHGGKGILTGDHPNGTSRVWETFKKIKNENVDLIVNMQGDQVMLSSRNISKLEKYSFNFKLISIPFFVIAKTAIFFIMLKIKN